MTLTINNIKDNNRQIFKDIKNIKYEYQGLNGCWLFITQNNNCEFAVSIDLLKEKFVIND